MQTQTWPAALQGHGIADIAETGGGQSLAHVLPRFETESVKGGKIADLRNELLSADERDVWDAVFDISSVRGGSFRMPFCDKMDKGRLEGRPILPEVVALSSGRWHSKSKPKAGSFRH